MDSNSKHCPSRSSADNLGDDQKDPNALPSSCATSSATATAGSEAGASRQPSASCGMEEITASVNESSSVGMKSKEDCGSSSQNVERPSGASPHRPSDITITLCRPPPCVVKIPADKHMCSVPIPSSQSTSASSDSKSVEDEASALSASCDATPRGCKRSHDEIQTEDVGSPSPAKHKNKKRCYKCSCKLELAQREIGRCRCDRVFCSLHRLPELHGCDFDHKEDGRREAREKMVKPTRHLGTSFRRLDSDS